MKTAVLPIVFALLALSTLSFAQPKSVSWDYPGDWDCTVTPPLTFGTCWTGTPIPDGTVMNILVNGVPTFQWPLNGNFVCDEGYFSTIYYDINGGSSVVLDIVYQGCHYASRPFTITTDETFLMYQADWTTCECGGICTPTESGTDGPYEIASGATKIFFAGNDTCTIRITAQGGIAHGVTVSLFDAVPAFHPTAYSYMSRVAAIYWNGTQDPATTLRVRMYYTATELNESGFTGSSCLIAARFSEFGVSWAPITLAGSGAQYIEFLTKRSGYYTFDCRATIARRIPTGGPTVSSGDKELVVRWQTRDEFENYCFHILRSENAEGPYVEVATVNSQLPDIMTTASYDYEYRDSGLENGSNYYYRLSSEDLHGNITDYPATVCGIPSVDGNAVEINEYRLYAAYPNPFNPETRITYDIRDLGHVTLSVFDILGREITRLVDAEQPRGRYNVAFNGTSLPSGLYFYRLDIGGNFTSTQKMLLLK
jgi:hypothetical protein